MDHYLQVFLESAWVSSIIPLGHEPTFFCHAIVRRVRYDITLRACYRGRHRRPDIQLAGGKSAAQIRKKIQRRHQRKTLWAGGRFFSHLWHFPAAVQLGAFVQTVRIAGRISGHEAPPGVAANHRRTDVQLWTVFMVSRWSGNQVIR